MASRSATGAPSSGTERLELDIVGAGVQRGLQRIEPRVRVDADGEVKRVGIRCQRLMEPAAGHVQHVPRLEDEIEHRRSRLAELGAVALVSERQLERRLVDEPPLAACHLEAEDIVRVVVDGQALGVAGREVRVRLYGLSELLFESAAEGGEWGMRGAALAKPGRTVRERGQGARMSIVPVNAAGRHGTSVA